MNTKMEYCALWYLNQWQSSEKEIHRMISSESKNERLMGINSGASYFRVARTIPTMPEKKNKKERYEPVLEVIDKYDAAGFTKDNLSKFVERVQRELNSFYKKNMLSATSKMLWLKFRSPIIILDSQAKKALNVKKNEYSKFVKEWDKEYNKYEREITDACGRLGECKSNSV